MNHSSIGRIRFPKSPWPDGHRIESIAWTARVEPRRSHPPRRHQARGLGRRRVPVAWTAKVCLSYAGATRYAHALEARIERAKLEAIRVPVWEHDEDRARAALVGVMRGSEPLLYVRRGRGFAFAETR